MRSTLLFFIALGCGARTSPTSEVTCGPSAACWPSPADWQALAGRLTGKLTRPASPLAPCRADFTGAACKAGLAEVSNPAALEDDPGATQSLGRLASWTPAPSAYAVEARSAADVQTAVDFARIHHLRLAVKGTGHDYLGRSNAPGSLLVWTHAMREITVHDAFVADGCDPATAVPAMTVEAGRAGSRRTVPRPSTAATSRAAAA